MGLQRVGHDLVTKCQQQGQRSYLIYENISRGFICKFPRLKTRGLVLYWCLMESETGKEERGGRNPQNAVTKQLLKQPCIE